ncbi:MAG: NAD-dependent epimerase, partial [Cyclobacteriaceae bacterium]|nr:NAD-dependent epimerase [Cyclobacteriaceae bacterium]
MNKILVTGAAGFIGFHLANRLLKEDWEVVGIDNLNDYYDVDLKNARLDILQKSENFKLHKVSLENLEEVKNVFEVEKPEYVVNLAAQAGVRYSLTNPHAYTSSNIEGFLNILEGCRHNGVKHLIYASSSSVYGANKNMPFSVGDNVDHPVSLYAATKKANELMAHTYSHLYNIPTTGLRFFTVYGPWGRPDMALFLFTKAILEEKPIDVFNHGMMKRDFTYIDDIVEGIYRLINHIPKPNNSWDALNPDPSFSKAPYKVFNIGNNQPVELNYFIESIEKALGKKAIKNLLPLQPGDVVETYANVDHLKDEVGFKP